MIPSGVVLAYHGCDREVGERVLSGAAEIQPSNNNYDWLGAGAYFWEGSSPCALEWARFLQRHEVYMHLGLLDSVPKTDLQRRKIMNFIRSLREHPDTRGDFTDKDSSLRERQIKMIGDYAITSGSMHP